MVVQLVAIFYVDTSATNIKESVEGHCSQMRAMHNNSYMKKLVKCCEQIRYSTHIIKRD